PNAVGHSGPRSSRSARIRNRGTSRQGRADVGQRHALPLAGHRPAALAKNGQSLTKAAAHGAAPRSTAQEAELQLAKNRRAARRNQELVVQPFLAVFTGVLLHPPSTRSQRTGEAYSTMVT